MANIIAVSDNGDTVRAQSLPDGNFVMNCQPESWTFFVTRQGFLPTSGRRVILSRNAIVRQDFTITRNPLVFSGTVRNSAGQPVIGATVRVLSEDGMTEIAALLSTPSTGRFSFPLLTGTYQISATKTGLVSHSSKLQFSASQDRNIVLESGAALLQGTLFGESYIAQNGTIERLTAAVVNARVLVINERGDTIATALTDRVYGTYSISVRGGNNEKYRLRFSAEGFNDGEVQTNSVIAAGNTYSQDFTLTARATISGRVFDENGANGLSGISVSLIDRNSNSRTYRQAIATSRSDAGGNFTFFRVPNGEFSISANGNGRAMSGNARLFASGSNDVIESSVINAVNGRFRSGDNDIASINISTVEANAEIIWTVRTNANSLDNDPATSVILFSPFVQKLDNGHLRGAVADPSVNYWVRATSNNDTNIIDLAEKLTRFPNSDSEILRETILMPFRYLPSTATYTSRTTLRVSRWQAVEIDSAFVYYRHRGETEFLERRRVSAQINDEELSFVVVPENPGGVIEFYFDIFTNNRERYSNRTNLFTRRVLANQNIITRWEVLPVIDNITLALNGRIELSVKAYYGADFRPIQLQANQFEWSVSDNLGISRGDNASAIITGRRAGNDGWITIRMGAGLEKANDNIPSEIRLPIRVTNSEIAQIQAIMLSELERPEFLNNSERAIFGVEARDRNGTLVSARPQWIVNPANAELEPGHINRTNGIFVPNPEFIGRAYIVAQVNSRVRSEFIFNGERGLLIAHTVNSAGGTVSNFTSNNQKSAELSFARGATENPIVISLDRPNIRNFVERDVTEQGVIVISDIYEIRRRIGEDFAASVAADARSVSDTSDESTRSASNTPPPVSLRLFVPQIYHNYLRNGQRDENKLGIAIWDEANLRWEYAGRKEDVSDTTPSLTPILARYNPEDKSLSIPIGGYINELNTVRFAIIGKGLKADADISISPNPFSPFVSPMSDFLHISGMSGDVMGTCIRITTRSNNTKFKPSAQVSIFTADGTLVYRATLNGLDAGQSYYLFWDGRKQLSPTAFSGVDILPNTAIFVRGDEMLRNGRYFVNITIDDGKEKKRHTREIILFK